jgi:hypothetical protein
MTDLEKKMVETLKDLKESHGVVGVKAEFEAEGTRLDEAIRLKEVVTRAGLDLAIKIGGCEAVKDLYEAKGIGVNKIIAPMIESSYALKKYLGAINITFNEYEKKDVEFLINIETKQAFENIDDILNSENINELDGIVIGRVDLSGSLGLKRDEVNCEQIYNITKTTFEKAKAKNLICAMGGGIAAEALPFIRRLADQKLLDYFETRKVLFKCPDVLNKDPEIGILKAVGFELLWLKNKRNYYGAIFAEDDERITMLEKRYEKLIEKAGGKYK